MKKIIIVNNNLEVGGVQTSLINLLKEIHNLYDVTLLLFNVKSEYLEKIPYNVKVETVKYPFKHFGMSSKDVRANPFLFLSRGVWAVLTRLFGRKFVIKMMLPFHKKIRGYDCAISYLHEDAPKRFYGGCNEFVIHRIDADKKIGWIHCDYSMCGANNEGSRRIYKQFDKIIACSEGAKYAFLRCLPECEDKCVAVRNCNDYETIKQKSHPAVNYNKNIFNVVTVARLSAEKAIHRALVAIKYCKDKGYLIAYHIVGAGPEEDYLKRLVLEMGLEENVFFYGNQSNPYPYLMNADLFLLTSYHEAAPMVFDESMSLGVPVMATATTSTDEMITEHGGGFVCANVQDDINTQLLHILRNPQELANVKKRLKQMKFNNSIAIEKLRRIL